MFGDMGAQKQQGEVQSSEMHLLLGRERKMSLRPLGGHKATWYWLHSSVATNHKLLHEPLLSSHTPLSPYQARCGDEGGGTTWLVLGGGANPLGLDSKPFLFLPPFSLQTHTTNTTDLKTGFLML